jgi:hypothetical protein
MANEIVVRNGKLLAQLGILLGGIAIFMYYGFLLGSVVYLLLSRWLAKGFAVHGSHMLYAATVLALGACIATLLVVLFVATVQLARVVEGYLRLWRGKIICGEDEIILTSRYGAVRVHRSEILRFSVAAGGARIEYLKSGRARWLRLPARAFRAVDFAALRSQLERLAEISETRVGRYTGPDDFRSAEFHDKGSSDDRQMDG